MSRKQFKIETSTRQRTCTNCHRPIKAGSLHLRFESGKGHVYQVVGNLHIRCFANLWRAYD